MPFCLRWLLKTTVQCSNGNDRLPSPRAANALFQRGSENFTNRRVLRRSLGPRLELLHLRRAVFGDDGFGVFQEIGEIGDLGLQPVIAMTERPLL